MPQLTDKDRKLALAIAKADLSFHDKQIAKVAERIGKAQQELVELEGERRRLDRTIEKLEEQLGVAQD